MSVDPITCHILDTSIGKPASNVTCSIYYISPLINDPNDESAYEVTNSKPFAMAKTDNDGRIKNWVYDPSLDAKDKLSIGIADNNWNKLMPGIYKIKFLTGKYFHNLKEKNRTFFPFVEVVFEVANPPDNHYHIPLLLSNHSYTTYRGS
mmetsp:Transcript_1004/g.1002  ORF Transcript_1004/g.1002 Transcript_1004/m.1002 type:complete len:149 (-) Transcript_1004:8-454(-)